jgi:hypothetical protein
MTEPEVLVGRYFVLAALAFLLVSRALIALVRAARARALSPRHPGPPHDEAHAGPAHVVDIVADVKDDLARARPTSRAAPRRTHAEGLPNAGDSARDLRAAVVTMEVLGPPRAFSL